MTEQEELPVSDEGDIKVRIETLNEMEDIMEELGLEVFGDADDD